MDVTLRSSRLLLAVVVCVLLVGATATAESAPEAICSDAAVYFCENFEDRTTPVSLLDNLGGKTTGWAVSDFEGSLTISTTEAAEGSKALQFNYPACSWTGSQDGCGAGFMQSALFTGLPEIYVRHYVKWDTGFVWSPTADKHMFVNSGSFREPSTFWTLWGVVEPIMLVTSPTYQEYDQNVQPVDLVWETGQWYCLEVHLTRVNSTTAHIEGWIDGVQRWDYTNVPASTDTNGWDSVEPSGYWNTSATPGSRGAQTRWMDAIVVSTERIGCLDGDGGTRTPGSGAVAMTGTTASRVIGTILAPRAAIRGAFGVLIIAAPFALMLLANAEAAMSMRDRRRVTVYQRVLETLRESDPSEAMKWSALAVAGSVSILTVIVALAEIARWISAVLALIAPVIRGN